jgi:hypothetical protein
MLLEVALQFTSQAKILLARQFSTRETTPTHTAAIAPHQSTNHHITYETCKTGLLSPILHTVFTTSG